MTSTSTTNLKETARKILSSICNKRGFTSVRPRMHENIHAHHDSFPPAIGPTQYLERWQASLKFMPDFQSEILDLVAEVDEVKKAGGRVWTYSKIVCGRNGEQRDGVDMMFIDEVGKTVEARDCQRMLNTESA